MYKILFYSDFSQHCKESLTIAQQMDDEFITFNIDHPKIRSQILKNKKINITVVPTIIVINNDKIEKFEGDNALQFLIQLKTYKSSLFNPPQQPHPPSPPQQQPPPPSPPQQQSPSPSPLQQQLPQQQPPPPSPLQQQLPQQQPPPPSPLQQQLPQQYEINDKLKTNIEDILDNTDTNTNTITNTNTKTKTPKIKRRMSRFKDTNNSNKLLLNVDQQVNNKKDGGENNEEERGGYGGGDEEEGDGQDGIGDGGDGGDGGGDGIKLDNIMKSNKKVKELNEKVATMRNNRKSIKIEN